MYICVLIKIYKKMDSLEKLIRKETNYMFAEGFYENFTKKILSFVSENKHTSGFVYFIKNGSSSNKIKIGSAIDIDKRILSYQTAFYEKIFIVGYIKSDDYIFLEKEIHKTFSDKRIKGEWFEIDQLDFYTLRELYCFYDINDFYKKNIKITDMPNNLQLNEFNETIDFCKKLELNKVYKTSDLFKEFKGMYPSLSNKTISWFGRDLSKCLKIIGIKKISNTNGGIRTFILK